MRLFVAVDPDPTIRVRVETATAALRSRLTGTGASIAWVLPEKLHLTLVFLGEVNGMAVDRITHAVAAGWSQELFSVTLPAAGVFPDSGAPRVICLAAGEGFNALGTLHTAVCKRLEELIFRHEEGVFRTHLTLGRVRHSTPGVGRLIRKVLKGLPLMLAG